MTETKAQPRRGRWLAPIVAGPPSWTSVVLLALGLRVAAADLVQWYAQHKGVVCLFPDSFYYWFLAGKIARGEPYERVEFGDLPHFALRAPGYPAFLAVCQWLFGPRVLPARLVQAALGAACVGLIARLTRRALPGTDAPNAPSAWSPPLLAGLLVAIEPFTVANSAFLLSEAVFVPLLLLTQWGLAEVWRPGESGARRAVCWSILTGAGWGAAVLTRPSWALYVPLALGCYVALAAGRRRAALGHAGVMALGFVLVMAPWWWRNGAIYGRFVPTALWAGASLYDGLNPRATGASDMSFLGDPEFWPLDEEAQDALLRDRALDFARSHPAAVARLAAVKLARFWSPWPNAEGVFSIRVALASAAVTLPVFGAIAWGAWLYRRAPRALVLVLLPLFYTMGLHLLFVSSMRYRVPVIVPAFALAAVAIHRARQRAPGTDPPGTNASWADPAEPDQPSRDGEFPRSCAYDADTD